MGIVRVVRSSMKDYVCETLTDEIQSGDLPVGSQLPSIRALARRFGTSISPVHQALEVLESQGYVVKRSGAGTFVADTREALTLSQSVALCLRLRAHVWGDLGLTLAERLHGAGWLPVMADTAAASGCEQLRRVMRADVKALVLHGHAGFPYHVLDENGFRQKRIIAVAEWAAPPRPGLIQILSDHESGGRRLARHLHERGHRSLLVVSPKREHLIASVNAPGMHYAPAFIAEWERLGCRWRPLISLGWKNNLPEMDAGELCSHFDGSPAAPTAIFGLMDIEALTAHRLLSRQDPALGSRVEVVGYFNTPWSQAGSPSFTSVDLRLDVLADRVCSALDAVLAGNQPEETVQMVQPRLVVRS